MKTTIELNAAILQITAVIQKEFPELMTYLNEMPETIPDVKNPEISNNVLQVYFDSLENLLRKYAPNHSSLTAKL